MPLTLTEDGHPCICGCHPKCQVWEQECREPSANNRSITTNTMTKVVSLQQIPTIRELYQRAVIAARPVTGRDARFPVSSKLLDRVSV